MLYNVYRNILTMRACFAFRSIVLDFIGPRVIFSERNAVETRTPVILNPLFRFESIQ